MRIPVPAAFGISAALHAAAMLGLTRVPALAKAENVSVEIVEDAPAPPPPAPAPEPVARPTRRAAALAPPRAAPPPAPAPDLAPPPPNEPPPPDAPRAPVRIGVALSSSTTGGVAAPAGNTLYGELPRQAPDPSSVQPYRSERYVPPTQVTVLPRPIGECLPPPSEYPEAALRLGIEGVAVLVLTIDEKGAIADARVVEDPGHGLGDAAVRSVKRHCRFEPGRRGDEAVTTSIRYRFRFELP